MKLKGLHKGFHHLNEKTIHKMEGGQMALPAIHLTKNLNIDLPHDPAIPLLLQILLICVYGCSIHNR